MTRSLPLRCAAEAAGTALLVGIGTGSIVYAASHGGVAQWVMALAWLVAVLVPVEIFAFVSGAHLNPAVTLALVGSRRFPAMEAMPYVGAQVVGAFAASAGVLGLLGGAAHLGATLPKDGDIAAVFPLEFVFTFLLVLSVFYLTCPGKVPSRVELLSPALVVGLSTFLIGPWTGSSLNPARTLAPAVLSGDYLGLWAYLVVVPVAALCAVGLLRVQEKGVRSRRTYAGPAER